MGGADAELKEMFDFVAESAKKRAEASEARENRELALRAADREEAQTRHQQAMAQAAQSQNQIAGLLQLIANRLPTQPNA